MLSRSLVAGTAIATVMALSGASTAVATPIDLGGYTGPITVKFANYESFTNGAATPGSQNFGIFEITSILDSSSNIIYQAPISPSAANPLILGVFSGITVLSTSGAPPNQNVFATGGVFSLYDDTTTPFGTIALQGTAGYAAALPAPCAVNTQCYNGITNSFGTATPNTNILNLSLVPGATSLNLAATLFSQITVASPLTGNSSGFGDITGGTDAFQFGHGGFTTAAGTLADVAFEDDFCAGSVPGGAACATPPISNWALGSQDPIRALAVPEPASIALLGSALIGMGFSVRRRRRNRSA